MVAALRLFLVLVAFGLATPSVQAAKTQNDQRSSDRSVEVHDLLEAAVELRDTGRSVESRQALAKALRLIPEYPPTLILLAKHAFRDGDRDIAADFLERAEAASARASAAEGEYRLALGSVYREVGEPDLAEAAIRAALAAGQDNDTPLLVARAHIALGTARVEDKNAPEAGPHFQAAGEILSTSPHTALATEARRLWLSGIADYHQLRERYPDAIEALNLLSSITIHPLDHAEIASRLGYIKLEQNDFLKAEQFFLGAIEVFDEILGRDHPSSKAAHKALATARLEHNSHADD